jgi:hypothetical protein
MLSPLDDYPVHQIAAPIRHVATSDRNFYDRYYFNCHPSSGDMFLIFGLGQYPNLEVSDTFALLRRGDLHRVVRASRTMSADRRDTTVGPFRIEVLEGLRRLRVVLEPNEWGLAFDLTWEGAIPATVEPRHLVRNNLGRVIIDACRLAQTGRWTGQVEIDGETVAVTPANWWGSRDRSWGIRPIGEPEPAGAAAARPPGTFYWVYAPIQLPSSSILVIVQEDADGRRIMEEAVRVWPEETGRPAEHLGRPEIRLDFIPGTRAVRGATIRFARGDDKLPEIGVEVALAAHLGVGTGYGQDTDWRHGMYQGPLAVSGLSLDLSRDEDRKRMVGLVDNVARFECDGEIGWGLFEVLVAGPHRPSGFTSWTDTAG